MDNSLKLIVEALVFASEEPLTPQQIRELLPETDLKEIRAVLVELKAEYQQMKRSFIIREVAKGYQFCTLPRFRPYIAKMLSSIAHSHLISRRDPARAESPENLQSYLQLK